jgi:hypothetical protein
MAEGSNIALVSKSERPTGTADDTLTLSALSIVAAILTNVLHEGVGHGLTALLTGANSGALTTVAWSRAFDSRLVEAGGTLVNLAAALVFWWALRSAKNAGMSIRYFLLITCAFNFTGTVRLGYSAVERCRPAESTGNTTTVAIGPACDRWRSKWVAVVAMAAILTFVYVVVLGRGITWHR